MIVGDAHLGDSVAITVDLVKQLVQEQFPHWRDMPIGSIDPGGWDNRSFRMGDSFVIKLPRAERYAVQPAKEYRYLAMLGTQLPLAVPVPVALGQPSNIYPWHWIVHRWIGRDYS